LRKLTSVLGDGIVADDSLERTNSGNVYRTGPAGSTEFDCFDEQVKSKVL
jgi:hypothetical protein